MLGIIYVVVAARKPDVPILFGVAYGLAAAVLLDYIAVHIMGWGATAWETPLNTHLSRLSAHIVFGAALETARRIGFLLF